MLVQLRVVNLYHQVTNYANTGGLQYNQMYSTTPAVGDPQLARVDLYTRVVSLIGNTTCGRLLHYYYYGPFRLL